ncbi:MAG TPA: hypothetical protein VNI02_02315 [Blastocatellia bacterium]|jgi:hypothetical protein|nr:hypothetical protein [Blastocatellia bacterium]
MGTKGKQHIALILALGAALTASPVAPAQVKGKGKASRVAASVPGGGVEPLRVINGQMRGRTIAGQFRVNGRRSDFSFALSGAEVVEGRLRLTGDFRLGDSARAAAPVKAKVAGTMAKAANPWPSSSDDEPKPKPKAQANEQQQGREAKSAEAAGQLGQLAQSTQDTARKTPPAPGERTEQTQSLYAQAEMGTGCGVFFLSMDVPPRLRAAMGAGPLPVQIGVVLAPFDNSLGEEVNRRICALVRMSGDKSAGSRMSASVEEFNRFLASSR